MRFQKMTVYDTIADKTCNPNIETIFVPQNGTGTSTSTNYVKANNFDWQSLIALLMWILAVLYSRCVMDSVQLFIFIFSNCLFEALIASSYPSVCSFKIKLFTLRRLIKILDQIHLQTWNRYCFCSKNVDQSRSFPNL